MRSNAIPLMSLIGRSVRRKEDPPLVTGRGSFAADVSFPHQLHMRVVRSPFAHGRIREIDTGAALAAPGVVAIWTADDVEDIPPIDFRLTRIEGLEPYRQRVLAKDRVRYVGDPVAVVFATDPYLAEDAADLVELDIEELPVALDASAAPVEFEPGRTTEAAIIRKGYGDVDSAFRERACDRRTRSLGRAAFRRADGNARRHRPLRRRARHPGNVRRRQGAALEPRSARPHARTQSVQHASA